MFFGRVLFCVIRLIWVSIEFSRYSFRAHLPFGNVPGLVAALGDVVEHLAGGAAVTSRIPGVDAHVKILTIFRIGVERVDGAAGVLLLQRRTDKVDDLFGAAADAARVSRPRARARLVVEHQTVRTGDEVELAVGAEEELVADGRVGVGKVAVASRTVGARIRGFCPSIRQYNRQI